MELFPESFDICQILKIAMLLVLPLLLGVRLYRQAALSDRNDKQRRRKLSDDARKLSQEVEHVICELEKNRHTAKAGKLLSIAGSLFALGSAAVTAGIAVPFCVAAAFSTAGQVLSAASSATSHVSIKDKLQSVQKNWDEFRKFYLQVIKDLSEEQAAHMLASAEPDCCGLTASVAPLSVQGGALVGSAVCVSKAAKAASPFQSVLTKLTSIIPVEISFLSKKAVSHSSKMLGNVCVAANVVSLAFDIYDFSHGTHGDATVEKLRSIKQFLDKAAGGQV